MKILSALIIGIVLSACTNTPAKVEKPVVVAVDACVTPTDGGQVDQKPTATPVLGTAQKK